MRIEELRVDRSRGIGLQDAADPVRVQHPVPAIQDFPRHRVNQDFVFLRQPGWFEHDLPRQARLRGHREHDEPRVDVGLERASSKLRQLLLSRWPACRLRPKASSGRTLSMAARTASSAVMTAAGRFEIGMAV
jgi:hypothetical protein